MYALWHSVQVSLYIPDSVNLSGVGLCGVSSLPMVLFVWEAYPEVCVFEQVCDV
jgi:hypothetical protein